MSELQLSDRKWQEFFIGDIFFIHTGKDLILSQVENGDILMYAEKNGQKYLVN